MYGFNIQVKGGFTDAVQRVTEALKTEGFGVLTDIDVQATMKAKLGADLEPYLILGACNPPLALRALQVDPSLGLLLPCNVVVRGDGADTIVEATDPHITATLSVEPALQSVADEAAGMLGAAIAALTA